MSRTGRFANEAPRQIDRPRPGYFKLRLIKGGPYVPARLWLSPPRDPLTGEMLDRIPGPVVQVAHFPVTDDPRRVAQVWESGETISPATHAYMCVKADWARTYSPHAPAANPLRRVDLLTAPPPF